MANETTTTSLTELVDTFLTRGRFYFKKAGVMPNLVDRLSLIGFPGKAGNFNRWDAKASTDVQTGSEGTDYTTNLKIETSVAAGTVAEYLLMSVITDLARDSAIENVYDGVIQTLSNAMALKLDDTLVNMFSGGDVSVAGAGVTLLLDHFNDATQLLENVGAPRPYAFVGHPKQIWGAKGLSGIFDASTINAASSAGESFIQSGIIGNLGGFSINWSTEINDDTATLGDAAGAFLSRDGLGLIDKGVFNVEIERNASMRGAEVVIQGLWKEVEIKGDRIVYALSDVA